MNSTKPVARALAITSTTDSTVIVEKLRRKSTSGTVMAAA